MNRTRTRRRLGIVLSCAAIGGTGLAVVPSALAWNEVVKITVTCDGYTITYTNKDSKTHIIRIKGDTTGTTYVAPPGKPVQIPFPSFLEAGDQLVFEQSWDGKNWQDTTDAKTVPDLPPAEVCNPPVPEMPEEPEFTPQPEAPVEETPVVTPPPPPAPVASCPLVAANIRGLAPRIWVNRTDGFKIILRNTGSEPARVVVNITAKGAGTLTTSRRRVVRMAPGGRAVLRSRVKATRTGRGTVLVRLRSNGLACGQTGDSFRSLVKVTPPPVQPYTP